MDESRAVSGDPLTPLERDVLSAILSASDPVVDGLRAQLAVCRVQSRELTGHGFFTDFVVPPRLAVAGIGRTVLDGVQAELDGLRHGAGFVLFVEDGLLATLEGYAFDEPWPGRVEGYTVMSVEEVSNSLARVSTVRTVVKAIAMAGLIALVMLAVIVLIFGGIVMWLISLRGG